MASKSVVGILEQLEGTQGKNAKREILDVNRKNTLLKDFFVAAQDPYTVYYVTKFPMPAPDPRIGVGDEAVEHFLKDILPQLSSRKVTGDAAKVLVKKTFAVMNELEQKWCQRLLLRNLRCGLQENSVNKTWPGALNSFSVALACTLKSDFVKGEGIKILEKVTYPVRVEPKLDGLRCIAVKKAGEVTFYTRNGTVLESMPRIKAALETAKYDNVVLDGEGMAADWNESSSVMMSGRGSNKDHAKDDKNLYYNVFDAMPLEDWVAQETELVYGERCDLVAGVVEVADSKHVRQVPHINAKDEAELKAYFAKCMDEGFEGVMLKTLDSTYEWDRSKNILKLKPVVTYEGVICGHYEGRVGTKREGLFGGFQLLLPNGVITRVGGGMNDALKARIELEGPDTWIGKIAEIEAQPDPLTADGLTKDGKARFPVYIRERSPADVDPKVMMAFKAWKAENA